MRANGTRSALTVLGVVIGVATVMAMASIVQGIRAQIFTALDIAGPRVFYVMRFFSQTPIDPTFSNIVRIARFHFLMNVSFVTCVRGGGVLNVAIRIFL